MSQATVEEKSKLRVIIVGGSVAGLTLAHCLAKANIDHIVLEKRTEISPQEGAFIGIWPNGARIFDQLGLYDDFESLTPPVHRMNVRFPDGFTFSSYLPRTIQERFGYPIISIDRQKVLETLYERYPHKSNVLVNKKVMNVRLSGKGVSVVTEDGSAYDGDLVVGADGIHSRIRSEMWRLADENHPGLITSQDKKAFTVEYACVFGISEQLPSLPAGEHINSYSNGLCVITFHGEKGRIFWFLLVKLPEKTTYPNTPRFSASDAASLCNKFARFRVSEDVCVSDLWMHKLCASMTALEEGILERWHYDRIVLLGDSVHKMTPNIGQGANTALEDASVLASLLNNLSKLSTEDGTSAYAMTKLLNEYQSTRYERAKNTHDKSRFGARLHTRDDMIKTLIGRYVFPYAGPRVLERSVKSLATAHSVEYLPFPKRLGPAWGEYSSPNKSTLGTTPIHMLTLLLPCLFYFMYSKLNLFVSL
uniref:FAD-binding domain-containing protein n=1 Tax=Penicillium brasilianum TaxID=104259 RepID=A0A411F741_PENBI|nr:hypothetical protein PM-122-9-1376 [Penicillium brasilianum]